MLQFPQTIRIITTLYYKKKIFFGGKRLNINTESELLGFPLIASKEPVPNWKEGNGGESSWSHMFFPLRWAATMVFPRREDSKSERETPSMTLGSSAISDRLIFLPIQFSSMALRAASTSGNSGISSVVWPASSLEFSRAFWFVARG